MRPTIAYHERQMFTHSTARSARLLRGTPQVGHGWTTANSIEPPMPRPETHGGHSRPLPQWKARVWDGEKWSEQP